MVQAKLLRKTLRQTQSEAQAFLLVRCIRSWHGTALEHVSACTREVEALAEGYLMDLMTDAVQSMPSSDVLFCPVQANAILQEVDSSTAGNRLQIVFERQADISPEALAELIDKA